MTTAAITVPVSVCGRPHREDQIEDRWDRLTRDIEALAAEDHAAQWSTIGACACCCGPLKLTAHVQDNRWTAPDEAFMCSRCSKEDAK